MDSSSSSYKPSNDDEEDFVPHILVKRNVGPSTLLAPSSPIASKTPVPSPVHEHTSPIPSPVHK